MSFSERLFARLDAIAAVLRDSGDGLALLALGSVGRERERIDAYSDLDFFAFVRPGTAGNFLENVDWLARAHPIAYAYRNTPDGYKALFADGLFAEFAVFEPDMLAPIPFAPGHVVWQAPGFDMNLEPRPERAVRPPAEREYRIGELLTCLFIGLGRFRRGEVAASHRLVQVYAVEHLLTLLEESLPAVPGVRTDPFAVERRFEQRFPDLAANLPRLLPGYGRCPEAARTCLELLERHVAPANPAIRAAILARA